MSFEKAYAQTAKHEGGYVKDPADAGGETFRGISRRNHPAWPGWKCVDHCKELAEVAGCKTPESIAKYIDRFFAGDKGMDTLVKDFYRKEYWARLEKEAKA